MVSFTTTNYISLPPTFQTHTDVTAMLSNDENITRIADFIEEAKHWLLLKKDYAKLDLIHKVVVIFTALTIAFVIALLTLLALIYMSFAVAYYLGDIIHSMPLAFLAVSLFYLIILLIVLAKRRTLIERPLVRFLISIFMEDPKTK